MNNSGSQKQVQRITVKRRQLLRTYMSEGLALPFADFVTKYSSVSVPDELLEDRISSQPQDIDWELVELQIDMIFEEEEAQIAYGILKSLDYRGYFSGDIRGLSSQYNVSLSKVEEVRKKLITQVEPYGLGSLGEDEFSEIIRQLKLDRREHPIESQDNSLRQTEPDFYISIEDGTFTLRLNDKYEYVIQNTTGIYKVVAEYRMDLIRRLAQLIIENCASELANGRMTFLTLDQAAHALGVSKSTVSRLAKSKVFDFCGTLYDVSHFFTRSIKGIPQGELLMEIATILKENPTATDEMIAQLLRIRKGWKFSRRTVNKYRNILREYETKT